MFRENSHQNQIYDTCVKDLVLGCFDGYNAAILAYGQTGSIEIWFIQVARPSQWEHPQITLVV